MTRKVALLACRRFPLERKGPKVVQIEKFDAASGTFISLDGEENRFGAALRREIAASSEMTKRGPHSSVGRARPW